MFGRLMMSTNWLRTIGMYGCISTPICMHISPMAQVALLQTEMNSGFRLVPRIGMNSAEETEKYKRKIIGQDTQKCE